MGREDQSAPRTSRIRFGAFAFEPAAGDLFYRGARVPVQDMPLQVLAMLLERPGELIRRDEFFKHLWPDDKLGVLDANLNAAVHKLRVALRDPADHPNYIETVPRRGYRFIAQVEVAPRDQLQTSAPSSTTAPDSGRFSTWWLALPAALLLAMAALFMFPDRNGQPLPTDQAPSVAVLPFINFSDDPAQVYFSDGLTEELIDRLARVEQIRVVARTSSFAFRNRDMDVREIGRQLGASALLEGSIRRDGDRLRITAQLIDTSNGYHLWSESYDRRLDDILAIQQDIAQAISETLKGRLLDSSEIAALNPEFVDPQAYDLYLRGRYFWHRRTENGLRQAVNYFEQAVERAPNYAPTWAGLADAYAVLGFYDYLPPIEAFSTAREAAKTALELDPDNTSAWATLGYVALYHDWDFERGEAAFRRAIEIDPEDSKARQWYANLLTAAGRNEEAVFQMRRAWQLDPLSLIANAALGWVKYLGGNPEQALEQLQLALELDSSFELAYLWSGWALESLGRYDEALEMLNNAVQLSAGSGISVASLARLHGLRGEHGQARNYLASLESGSGYLPSYEIGKAWLALDETDLALEWIERALDERSHSMVFIMVDPQLEALRNHAGFQQLANRVRPVP